MRFFRSTATFRADAFFEVSPVAIAACTPPGSVQEEAALLWTDPSQPLTGPPHSGGVSEGMLPAGHDPRPKGSIHLSQRDAQRVALFWCRCPTQGTELRLSPFLSPRLLRDLIVTSPRRPVIVQTEHDGSIYLF